MTEALNTDMEQFGQEGLAELLRQNANLRAADMLHAVRQSLSAFGGDQPLVDDLAMVALKVVG